MFKDINNICILGTGLDILEPHIRSGLGVSFKGDNRKYLSVIGRSGGVRNIEAEKGNKDFWTKFTIEKIDNYNVYLKSADNKYLSRIHRNGVDHIEAAKSTRDKHCIFRVFDVNGKVSLRADNGKFVSRIYRGDQNNMEAAKGSADIYTQLIVETGSITPVKEVIESISWGTYTAPVDINPTVIGSLQQRNGGSRDLVKNFVFEKTIQTTQVTNWEHSWGVTAGISYTATAGINVGVASGSTSLTLSAEVRYDGKKGGNKGETKTTKFSDKTTVTIPPKKWVTVNFMVKKVNNAEVPFTATIKRTSEVGVSRITQKGVWRGIMVLDSYIEVIERNL